MIIKRVATLIICCIFLAFTLLFKITSPTLAYTFPEYSVTNIIIVPSDVEMDPEYPKLVSEAVKKVQARYAELLGGKTFTINNQNSGDVIVHKSTKSLKQFCPSSGCNINTDLEENDFPVFKNHTVLNTFLVGARYDDYAVGRGDSINGSGITWMADFVLSALKGNLSRNEQLICQQWLGGNCEADSGLHVIAHELGHAFGLLMTSRWAKAHPCSTASKKECRPDLDPKFYPTPVEWNHSLMGYGGGFYLSLGLNDSCVNPEKTILLASPYFGGEGYRNLNFDNCLKPLSSVDLKITNIDGGNTLYEQDEIVIITEGLSGDDADIQVIFPPDEPSRAIERLESNKIKAVVPRSFSGDIIITAQRRGIGEIRSRPYPVKILTRSPIIERVESEIQRPEPIIRPGDIVKIFGKNFIDERPHLKSLQPKIKTGQHWIVPLEYTKDLIRFQLPQDINVGDDVSLYIQVPTVNITTNRYEVFYSNFFSIKIHSGTLQARITKSGEFISQPIQFTLWASQTGETPRAAEIYVQNLDKETYCQNQKSENWCLVSKTTLSSGFPGQSQIITGTYIPKDPGTYLAIANLYSKDETKCSGDQERPKGWQDCGPESRITFDVSSQDTPKGPTKITAYYKITNKRNKVVWVQPQICEWKKNEMPCFLGPSHPIPSGKKDYLLEYDFYRTTGPREISLEREYEIACLVYSEYSDDFYYKCDFKLVKGGGAVSFEVNIPGEQATGEVDQVSCDLSASSDYIRAGEKITWTIKNTPLGTTAYWRGRNNSISILPAEVEGYSNTTEWSQTYRYSTEGAYERSVGIQNKDEKTICTTGTVAITVSGTRQIAPGQGTPTSTPSVAPNLQTGQEITIPKENTKSVVGILVNGQRLGFGGTSVPIRLPEIVARGATHAIPITISYSGKDGFVSRNLIFRYVVPGSENSGEKLSQGQACNPAKYSCFVMAEQASGSPERLFCRNMGGGYKWVTQKHAYELCQGKEGITSACKDKEGNETIYYCTGQDWANEAGWKEYQEKLKKAQEASKPLGVLPQGPLLERLQQLEEESKGLSCSLEAYPQKIKVGQEITWIIKTHNFTGTFAEWRGTDNGQELVIPVPVHEFPKSNSPNLWMENYPYNRDGTYTRYAVIRDSEGRTCQTNTLEAVIEDSSIAQGLPGGEALTSITQYVNQQPKTVSKIILLLPPYGQQKEVQPGERIQFTLPETGGVPQTIQLPITIIYSDGSTGNKTISFAYKGDTCALSGGKCADQIGDTRDGYTCKNYRTDLAGCGADKDNVYPYCFTGCSPRGTVPSGPTQTPQPTQTSTLTPVPTTPTSKNCVSFGYICADSVGITADGTKKCGLESYRSDYTGCSQYYYCYTSCGPNQTPTQSQTGTATVNCSGAGEFCADSGGGPKDSRYQCNTGNKAYRNNSAKDQWCQGGEPGWYCWLCQ